MFYITCDDCGEKITYKPYPAGTKEHPLCFCGKCWMKSRSCAGCGAILPHRDLIFYPEFFDYLCKDCAKEYKKKQNNP